MSASRLTIFKNLTKKIIISNEEVDAIDTIQKMTRFILDRPLLLQGLLNEHFILTACDMRLPVTDGSANHWAYLVEEKRFRTFHFLLKHNIIPNEHDMAVTSKENINLWLHLLRDVRDGLSIIRTLITEYDVFPDNLQLKQPYSPNSNFAGWHLMTQDMPNLLRFLRLNGKYPDKETAALTYNRPDSGTRNWWTDLLTFNTAYYVPTQEKIDFIKLIDPNASDLCVGQPVNTKWIHYVNSGSSASLIILAKLLLARPHLIHDDGDISTYFYPLVTSIYWPPDQDQFLMELSLLDIIDSCHETDNRFELRDREHGFSDGIRALLYRPRDSQSLEFSRTIELTSQYTAAEKIALQKSGFFRCALLLTHPGNHKFLGFLFYMYYMTGKHGHTIDKNIFYLISKHLLPPYMTNAHFNELFSPQNIGIFARYCLAWEYRYYNNISLLFKKHGERAESYRKAICKSNSPVELRKEITRQTLMSIHPGKTRYPEVLSAHHKPFNSKVSTDIRDQSFKYLMRIGYYLVRPITPTKPAEREVIEHCPESALK